MEETAEKSGQLLGKGVKKSFEFVEEFKDDIKRNRKDRTARKLGKYMGIGVKKGLRCTEEFSKGFQRGLNEL